MVVCGMLKFTNRIRGGGGGAERVVAQRTQISDEGRLAFPQRDMQDGSCREIVDTYNRQYFGILLGAPPNFAATPLCERR